MSDGDAYTDRDVIEALAGEGRVAVEPLTAPEDPRTRLDTPAGELVLGPPTHGVKKEGAEVNRRWELWNCMINYSVDGAPANRTHTLLVEDDPQRDDGGQS